MQGFVLPFIDIFLLPPPLFPLPTWLLRRELCRITTLQSKAPIENVGLFKVCSLLVGTTKGVRRPLAIMGLWQHWPPSSASVRGSQQAPHLPGHHARWTPTAPSWTPCCLAFRVEDDCREAEEPAGRGGDCPTSGIQVPAYLPAMMLAKWRSDTRNHNDIDQSCFLIVACLFTRI